MLLILHVFTEKQPQFTINNLAPLRTPLLL